MDLEKYRDRFNRENEFLKLIGAEVTVLREGYAEVEMETAPKLANVNKTVHGGVIFSLADTAVGIASKSYGFGSVTLEGKINYLRPIGPESGRIRAVAQSVHAGKKTGVYACGVYDGAGNLAAVGQFTMFLFADKPISV